MTNDDRIQELEAKVAQLTALLETQTTAPRPVPAVMETTSTEVDEARSSRRGLLKLAGAAAVGAAAAAASNAMPAAAASGSNMIVGSSNSSTVPDVTSLIGNMQVIAGSSSFGTLLSGIGGALAGWDTSNDSGNVRGGVVGLGGNFIFPATTTTHGVVGRMFNAAGGSGSGVYGISNASTAGISAGVRAKSDSGPSVQLEAVAASAPTTGSWTRGAIQPDTSGNLWYCVTSGTPGTWRKLTGASAAGAFHPLTPGRVYDSRAAAPAPGTLSSGGNRTISVANSRNPDGSVATADFVPAGATAVAANVTIVNTVNSGFLTVNPGGVVTTLSSTINWFGNNQILANGVTLTLDGSRQLTVVAGGGGICDFIIDISGYYL